MPSIEDVARRVGVSTATVSRALRGLPSVNAATRDRVLRAATEMGYSASPSASSLATGRTRSVAVVAPYPDRWFYTAVLAGAEEELRKAGLDLLLYGIPTAEARHHFFTELPLRKRVDGVVVVTLPMSDDEHRALTSVNIPVALVGLRRPGMSSVAIDDIAGAELAANHLLGLGHRRVALIGGAKSDPIHFATPIDRREGFRSAMRKAGIDTDPALEVDGEFTVAGGERAMQELLSLREHPSAVFAASDEMAVGAIRVIRAAGLRVPDDISMVGFDDQQIAALFDLTTVAQPVKEQGAMAARQITRALVDPTDEQSNETVPIRLVMRATTTPIHPQRSRSPTSRASPRTGTKEAARAAPT